MTTYHDSHSARMNINDWVVELIVDSDGHLSVYIDHKDKSPVIMCDIEMETDNDKQWADQFTTLNIERDYSDTQKTNKKGTK